LSSYWTVPLYSVGIGKAVTGITVDGVVGHRKEKEEII
jgi:hypothetical protein